MPPRVLLAFGLFAVVIALLLARWGGEQSREPPPRDVREGASGSEPRRPAVVPSGWG
jgi:hypothetical protein